MFAAVSSFVPDGLLKGPTGGGPQPVNQRITVRTVLKSPAAPSWGAGVCVSGFRSLLLIRFPARLIPVRSNRNHRQLKS